MASIEGIDSGLGYGVRGVSPTGSGVAGEGDAWAGVTASSVTGSGVSAFSDSGDGVLSVSNTGAGVSAQSVHGSGVAAGSDDGDAVSAVSGTGTGVDARSTTGNGVVGRTESASRAGVFGLTSAGQGAAVVGRSGGAGGVGVLGGSASGGSGVIGAADAGGIGVVGTGATGVQARGGTGPGLEAWSIADDGVTGLASGRLASGVVGTNHTPSASGVAGLSDGGIGVHGDSGAGIGVYGFSLGGVGIRGRSQGSVGVLAENAGDGVGLVVRSGRRGADVQAETDGLVVKAGAIGALVEGGFVGLGVTGGTFGAQVSGKAVGLFASSDKIGITASVPYGIGILSTTIEKDAVQAVVLQLGAAIHGKAGNPKAPSTYAGLFEGDVTVVGTLRKSSDKFVIDHPLDPAGRYLEHSVVESDEMRNLYDGEVVLDRRGRATVRLPRWFESLNDRVRYQLTPVGGAAPELHVAAELEDGRFEIAGGSPGLKVCWQVTGVRKDAWALANPMVVERRKGRGERGRYLHPELHGAGPEQSVFADTHPMADLPDPAVVERRDRVAVARPPRRPRGRQPGAPAVVPAVQDPSAP